jgi:hypothetical protein|tara:strand:+ start:1283 stop:2035 length:753 start_codon:yes stop_codon:yes gene_type:complete
MNIEQIKKKLHQLQSTTSTKENFWKPIPGKTQVRIVPYKFNKDNPFVELYFHYNLGNNKTFLSPVSFGRTDPVNEFSEKLKSSGNREEWLQGRKIEPKMRTFAPVVVRGQEKDGVKFWGFGKTVYQELLGFIADPDYGDISDPISGRDIVVERQTPAEAGNQYGKTTIRVKPNQTTITDDSKMLEKIFDSQVDLTELYKEPTYDELKEALENYLNPSDDNEEETKQSDDSNKSKSNTANIEDAFDKLFND